MEFSFDKIDSLKRPRKTIEDDDGGGVVSSGSDQNTDLSEQFNLESAKKKVKLSQRKKSTDRNKIEYSRQNKKSIGHHHNSLKIINLDKRIINHSTETSLRTLSAASSSSSSSSTSITSVVSVGQNDLNATATEKIIECQAENRNIKSDNEICHQAITTANNGTGQEHELKAAENIQQNLTNDRHSDGAVLERRKTVSEKLQRWDHHQQSTVSRTKKASHNKTEGDGKFQKKIVQKSNVRRLRSKSLSIDEEVHFRYRQYLNLEPELKDKFKTDYTYAHSFSYSPLVPSKEKYNWKVPNMSRQSVHHTRVFRCDEQNEHRTVSGKTDINGMLLDEASVSRRFVDNVPLSRIQKSTTMMTTRQRASGAEHPMHSTPLRTVANKIESTIKASITTTSNTISSATESARAQVLEFSDDDEDEMNNTVRDVNSPSKSSMAKTTKATTGIYPGTGATHSDHRLGNFYNEDEEEELTFIRRVKRYVTTTVRNTFGANAPTIAIGDNGDSHMDSDNGNLPSNTQGVHYQNQRNQYSSNLRNRHQQFLSVAARSHNTSWITNDDDQSDEEMNGSQKKARFWRRWPCWLCLLFLLLFPLLLGLSYYRYGGGAYLGNYLHLSDESSSRITEPGSSMTLPTFSAVTSLLAWPGLFFPSSSSSGSWWPLYWFRSRTNDPSSSETLTSHHQDLSQLTGEIFSLKQELLSLKRRQEEEKMVRQAEVETPQSVVGSPEIDALLERISQLELKLSACCRANWTEHMENHVMMAVDNKLNEMQRIYDSKLKQEIGNLRSYLMQFVEEHGASLNRSVEGQISARIVQFDTGRTTSSDGIDDLSEMQRLIQLALAKYDADKTGEADFALESSGAMVLSTRCSESYEIYSASYQLMGWTIWRSSCSPRVVFERGAVPGECWCFKGSEGRIAVKLSARIIPTAVSYEHIPLALSRDGHIRSAPHRFLVYGLRSVDDQQPELLGEYHYDIPNNKAELLNPPALQRFAIQNTEAARHTFQIIEFAIQSNHGHPDYTCLYRLRVHGELPVPLP